MHNLKDLMGTSEVICSSWLYWWEKLAAPNTSSGIPKLPMLLFVTSFTEVGAHKDAKGVQRQLGAVEVTTFMRYQS
jgi:hypothetical protein